MSLCIVAKKVNKTKLFRVIKMNSKVYKWCAVPQCKNTSIRTPNKVFVHVPNKKIIRDEWFMLARRNPNDVVSNSPIYFCEDHFDLPIDMENYMRYHLMGSESQVRMEPGCIPKKFACQLDKITEKSNNIERPYICKKRKMMVFEECEKQLEGSSKATEHREFDENFSGSSVSEGKIEVHQYKIADKQGKTVNKVYSIVTNEAKEITSGSGDFPLETINCKQELVESENEIDVFHENIPEMVMVNKIKKELVKAEEPSDIPEDFALESLECRKDLVKFETVETSQTQVTVKSEDHTDCLETFSIEPIRCRERALKIEDELDIKPEMIEYISLTNFMK